MRGCKRLASPRARCFCPSIATAASTLLTEAGCRRWRCTGWSSLRPTPDGSGSTPIATEPTRFGLAWPTSAAEAGVSERAIMNQTGHRSLPVMRGYIRSGTLFKENAAAHVGL